MLRITSYVQLQRQLGGQIDAAASREQLRSRVPELQHWSFQPVPRGSDVFYHRHYEPLLVGADVETLSRTAINLLDLHKPGQLTVRLHRFEDVTLVTGKRGYCLLQGQTASELSPCVPLFRPDEIELSARFETGFYAGHGFDSTNMAHFLFDVAGAAYHAREGHGFPEDQIFLNSTNSAYCEHILARAFPAARALDWKKAYFFKLLFVASSQPHPAFKGDPAFLSSLRAVFREASGPSGSINLYSSRRDSQRRRLLHEEVLESALREAGFDVLVGGAAAPEKQIETFRKAGLIVGPHGANLTNLVFAPEQGRVIEMLNPASGTLTYLAIARSLGLRYDYLMGTPATRDQMEWTIDHDALARLIDVPCIRSHAREGPTPDETARTLPAAPIDTAPAQPEGDREQDLKVLRAAIAGWRDARESADTAALFALSSGAVALIDRRPEGYFAWAWITKICAMHVFALMRDGRIEEAKAFYDSFLARHTRDPRGVFRPAVSYKPRRMVFVCGLHRSGTTLIRDVLAARFMVSTLKSSVPMNEGQFLQHEYPHDMAYGSAGKFAFSAQMRGASVTDPEEARRARENLLKAWEPWWTEPDNDVAIEKSPPNIVRIAYLRSVFPGSRFVVWTRDPRALIGATAKWGRTTSEVMLAHIHTAYSIAFDEMDEDCIVMRYEDFCRDPERELTRIAEFCRLERRKSEDATLQRKLGEIRNSNPVYMEKLEEQKLHIKAASWLLFGYDFH